jgi:SagB-type dehydrogenase family enzyme
MNNKISQYLGTNATEAFDASFVELFHESTKVMPSTGLTRDKRISNYLFNEECIKETCNNFKTYPNYPHVKLPKPKPIRKNFDSVINGRESCREFSGKTISLEDVSTILNTLQINRINEPLSEQSEYKLRLRKYPSPGGLYPTEVYLIASKVDELDPAVYHYNVKDNSLCMISELPAISQLSRALGDIDGGLVNQTGMVILLTGVLPRLTVKYENQGYRFALIEAGMVGLQLNLAAEGVGLGGLFWGGAYDDLVHDLIGVDGIEEVLLNVLWVGQKA